MKKFFPNIILIGGTGQNVGKTMLACEIINHLSETVKVIGIKISHHFHPVERDQKIIVNTYNYRIIEELLYTNKDSSRMKQAGATKTFYIQSEDEYLLETLQILKPEMADKFAICESGSLYRYIIPGLFLFVVR